MNDWQQEGKNFTDVIFTNCPGDAKNVQQELELLIILPHFILVHLLHAFMEHNTSKSLPKIRLFSRPQILSQTDGKMKFYNVTCLVGKYQIEHAPIF